MPILSAHEIAAWALIASGFAYAALASHGAATAVTVAALVAIAVQATLIRFI